VTSNLDETRSEVEDRSSKGRDSDTLGAEEWRDRYLRLAADLDNEKKRLAQNYARRAHETEARLIRDLLPLVDNLQRALEHATSGERAGGFVPGVQLSLKEFMDTLNKHGVEKIEALGQPFDPNLHEAVGSTSHPGYPSGTVVHVEQQGYLYNDRLLRPARVIIAA
jgi:molecular chaperone GrpE